MPEQNQELPHTNARRVPPHLSVSLRHDGTAKKPLADLSQDLKNKRDQAPATRSAFKIPQVSDESNDSGSGGSSGDWFQKSNNRQVGNINDGFQPDSK